MKIHVYSVQGVELDFLDTHPAVFEGVTVTTTAGLLSAETAALAAGCDAVVCFVNDDLSAPSLRALAALGVGAVLMRCAGYDRVDLEEAKALGVSVLRVPAYSPWAIAEHAVMLLLALNKSVVRVANRAKDHDFYLRGSIGQDIHGKVVGVIGTGKIGRIMCSIMKGFGTTVLAHDVFENEEMKALGVKYVPLDELLERSDFVSLHCPLLPATRHIINARSLEIMKRGALLVNCGRGALVETRALVNGLRTGKLGGVAMDVYEHEAGLFFKDRSGDLLVDNDFLVLQSFPTCLMTPHSSWVTVEALEAIWETTRKNLDFFVARRKGEAVEGAISENEVHCP